METSSYVSTEESFQTATSSFQDVSAEEVPPEAFLNAEIAVLVCIAVIGIPGNILIITLQAKNHDKTTTDYLVMNMAVIEFLYCSVLLPLRILVDLPEVWKSVASDTLCEFQYSLLYILPLGSAWFLAVIAVDRYIKTCKPLNTNYTNETAKKICVGITGVACCTGIPAAFSHRLNDNFKCYILQKNNILMLAMELFAVLTALFEFVIFIYTYTNIGLALRQRHRKRVLAKLPNSQTNVPHHSLKIGNFVNKLGGKKVQPLNKLNPNGEASSATGHGELYHSNENRPPESQDMNSCEDKSKSSSSVYTVQISCSITNNLAAAERTLNRTTLIMFLLTIIYIIIWTLVAVATLARRQGTFMGVILDRLAETLPMFNCITNPTFFFALSSKFRSDAKKLIVG